MQFKQIPVIIVNQSRSLANLICKYLKLTETTTQHRDDSTKHEHESKNTNHLPMLNHYFSEKILKEVFYPLGKIIVNIYKDLQQLYNYLLWFAKCLKSSCRDFIHVFDFKPTSSLQHTIYNSLVQARNNMPETKHKCPVTTDDQMCMALRWSITYVTDDVLTLNAIVWKDIKK
ncbi:unnamed protein product, partial [Rotaria sordida]